MNIDDAVEAYYIKKRVLSVAGLMWKFQIDKATAKSMLRKLEIYGEDCDYAKNGSLERIYLAKNDRIVDNKIVKEKKKHDFSDTDEEWKFILEMRNSKK